MCVIRKTNNTECWHTWVVEVELALEGLGLLLQREDPVKAVLAEDGHLPLVVVDLVLAQQLHDLAAHRRLTTKAQWKQVVWQNTDPWCLICHILPFHFWKWLSVQIKPKHKSSLTLYLLYLRVCGALIINPKLQMWICDIMATLGWCLKRSHHYQSDPNWSADLFSQC